jgi:hypothetical protein
MRFTRCELATESESNRRRVGHGIFAFLKVSLQSNPETSANRCIFSALAKVQPQAEVAIE